MHRIRLLVLLAAAALALTLAVSASAAVPKRFGTVGPGFTITLKNASGKTVKTVKAGKYTLVVTDKSTIHDFHIKGPGLNRVVTAVSFMGKKTITVTLKKGRYTFVCDPHASSMRGSFTAV